MVMMEGFAKCPNNSGKGIIPTKVNPKTTMRKTAVGLYRLRKRPTMIIAMASSRAIRVASGVNTVI